MALRMKAGATIVRSQDVAHHAGQFIARATTTADCDSQPSPQPRARSACAVPNLAPFVKTSLPSATSAGVTLLRALSGATSFETRYELSTSPTDS